MTDKVEMSDAEKKKEDWMNAKWRPMMGWMYMVVCTMDMVIFPILWSLLQTFHHQTIPQWNPLTLQGAGLFHIAMGAVLGLAAWGRTQEKLGGANNGGAQPAATTSPTTFSPAPAAPSSFSAPTTPSFGASSAPSGFGGGGFGSAPKPAATTMTSSTGKPMPIQPEQPEL